MIPNEEIEIDEAVLKEKITTLLDVVEQVSTVIEDENRALQAHDFATVREKVAQKTTLSRSYTEVFKLFRTNPELLKNADKERNGEIKAALTKLQELMNFNAVLLKSNMDANSKLIKLIINSAQTERAEQSSVYNAGASLNDVSGKPSAISYNKVL